MFIAHRVDITSLLQLDNRLVITFDSAYRRVECLRLQKGSLLCWNGHYGRVYARKAQYHFGWDWGPSLVTCGPWKPVYLECYQSRIVDIEVSTRLTPNFDAAEVVVTNAIEPQQAFPNIETQLLYPNGKVFATSTVADGSTTFKVTKPQLWFPHTHGNQPLYEVKAVLKSKSGLIIDCKSKKIGLRTIELLQTPLKEGSTFYFKVNGQPIFMGGSNWIPGDSFLPRVDPGRYRRWIDMAVRGNQNMLRVWGGGIYEDDIFYDECDQRGILVWQDFAFACGQYPSDNKFIQNVKEEATQAIARLRTHPSLAIWAGNNEDYQIANEGLEHDMNMPEDQWRQSTFGARYIYEKLLPDLVTKLSPDAIYWPGSPFGGVDNNSDRTIGDVHIWNVSSGMLLPYQRYPDITGRFVSEFGMMSCPDIHTVEESFFGESSDHHLQSEAFEFHCKASSYEKRMFTCMAENLRLSTDLSRYIYLTQLVQSEAMGYAYRNWRRQFEGRECGGALVWQLNDSWPVTSWALIDYHMRPKMAYYVVARAMKPLAIGIRRIPKVNPKPNLQHEAFCNGKTKADAAGVIAHATPHIYPEKESTFSVWVSNACVTERRVRVRLRFISIKSGLEVEPMKDQEMDAKPTGTTEVFDGDANETEPIVIVSDLLDLNGSLLSREIDWPQPLKRCKFPDRQLTVSQRGSGQLVLSVEKPVKALKFMNDGVEWSDNCLDLVPGDETIVTAKGLREPPTWMFYGQED